MQSWICNALSFSRFSPFLLPDFTVLPLIGAVDACFLADRSKSKLYRFDKDGNQWKERGAGTVKFLKHKASGKVRLLMRQSKTLKICANHLILPTMSVQEHAGNEKSCVWHARDFADGELKDELFCIRFPSIENCKSFMETFQEVAETQKAEDEKESSDAAGLIEKLSVEEKADAEKKDEEKSEDKTVEKESASGKESKAVEEPASSA
ncbi:Ran-binding protein 1-like b [Glycine soja]|uniref:RanBD1 domain-containing protein n=2 Tax=Glycine subgen. Soja TaxID=1462606 RepID=I1LDC2_SOYBN|nr:Ran-binding protein 1-like b [Glycine soja]